MEVKFFCGRTLNDSYQFFPRMPEFHFPRCSPCFIGAHNAYVPSAI
jgi:hypothetical protein